MHQKMTVFSSRQIRLIFLGEKKVGFLFALFSLFLKHREESRNRRFSAFFLKKKAQIWVFGFYCQKKAENVKFRLLLLKESRKCQISAFIAQRKPKSSICRHFGALLDIFIKESPIKVSFVRTKKEVSFKLLFCVSSDRSKVAIYCFATLLKCYH